MTTETPPTATEQRTFTPEELAAARREIAGRALVIYVARMKANMEAELARQAAESAKAQAA